MSNFLWTPPPPCFQRLTNLREHFGNTAATEPPFSYAAPSSVPHPSLRAPPFAGSLTPWTTIRSQRGVEPRQIVRGQSGEAAQLALRLDYATPHVSRRGRRPTNAHRSRRRSGAPRGLRIRRRLVQPALSPLGHRSPSDYERRHARTTCEPKHEHVQLSGTSPPSPLPALAHNAPPIPPSGEPPCPASSASRG